MAQRSYIFEVFIAKLLPDLDHDESLCILSKDSLQEFNMHDRVLV